MKSITGKKFARVLEERGRIERISIPIHGNRPLKIGLLRHLMKIAALGEQDFNE